jgi:hypothetical protein
MGTGASVHSNVTPQNFRTRVNTGIAVSGMWNAYVQANNMFVTSVPVSACPRVNVGASVSAGYASGSIQPYTDVLIQGCIGH